MTKINYQLQLQEIEEWLYPLFDNISCLEIYDHHVFTFSEIIKVKCLHDQIELRFVIKKYIFSFCPPFRTIPLTSDKQT